MACGLIIQIGGQTLSKLVAGAEEQAFDGRERHLEDVAELLIREFLVTSENDGETLFFWEGGDRKVECFFEFFVLRLDVRTMSGQIGELSRLIVIVFGFKRDLFAATTAAGFVEDEITGDGVEPGGEFGGRFVAWCAFPDPNEDLLGNIVGVIHISEHSGHGSNDGALMKFDELLKGPDVAVFDLEHELGADVFSRHTILPCINCRVYVLRLEWPDRFRHEETGRERAEGSGTHLGCKPCLFERVAGKVEKWIVPLRCFEERGV